MSHAANAQQSPQTPFQHLLALEDRPPLPAVAAGGGREVVGRGGTLRGGAGDEEGEGGAKGGGVVDQAGRGEALQEPGLGVGEALRAVEVRLGDPGMGVRGARLLAAPLFLGPLPRLRLPAAAAAGGARRSRRLGLGVEPLVEGALEGPGAALTNCVELGEGEAAGLALVPCGAVK